MDEPMMDFLIGNINDSLSSLTTPGDFYTNETQHNYSHVSCPSFQMPVSNLALIISYAFVCLIGLTGNTLVIYVVLRFSNMQTVTNMYILNLAIADECLLIGIPFLITTMHIHQWTFGQTMCKAYMVSTSITQFTSSIFLFIMSADRYMAICHHVSSPRYRTPMVSRIVAAIAWTVSAIVMLPIMVFSDVVVSHGRTSCQIVWPHNRETEYSHYFTIYSLLLGFAVPLCFIMTFYFLVIRKLRIVSRKAKKTSNKKRSHKKVTKLVLTVITVYILCWLPYWVSQVALISTEPKLCTTRLEITLFLLVGCLGYVNSAINPILYAYLSDNFKKSFMKACTCAATKEVNAQLKLENSVMPRKARNRKSSETPITLTTATTTTTLMCKNNVRRLTNEFLTNPNTTTTGMSNASSRNPSPAVARKGYPMNGANNNDEHTNFRMEMDYLTVDKL